MLRHLNFIETNQHVLRNVSEVYICHLIKTYEYRTLCPVILGILIKIPPCLSLPGLPRSSHSPKNFENETIKGFSHTIRPNYHISPT